MAEKDLSENLNEPSGVLPDLSLQIKKRARRRLVGAIALAVFAIIALPMVMDREPAPSGAEIQIQIPSQDGSTVASKTSLGGTKSVAAKPPKEPPVTKAIEEPKPVSSIDEKPPAASDSRLSTKPITPAVVAPVAKAEAKAEPAKPEIKSDAKLENKPDEKARAEAALLGKSSSTASQAANGANGTNGNNGKAESWVVQLGAYQNTGNVSILMAKLKEMRVPAYTEKFESPQGPRIRVRAGPFSSKEAALKAQTRCKIIGVTGPVAPVESK